MRVAIDARSIGPLEVGPGVYARQLIERLSRLAPEWTFHLYWGARPPGTVVPGGPNVHGRELGQLGGRKLGNLLFEQVLLPVAARRDRCALLWSPAFVLPVWKTMPQVVTMHDVIPLRFASSESLARRLVYHRLLRVNARQADRILTISECSASDLVRYLGVEPGKVQVVYCGRDASFTPLGAGDRAELAELLERLRVAPPYLLDTAGLLPRKNAHGVLEAFARVVDRQGRGGPQSLVFTGNTPGRGKDGYVDGLRRTAAALGVADRVHFIGYQARAAVRLLNCGALASVDVSFYEGFGFPVLEAMACGCPVITSDISSLPEVAGDAALLVDPRSVEAIAAAMARLAADASLRQRLRASGLARATRFSWDRSARSVLDLMRRITGDREAPVRAAA